MTDHLPECFWPDVPERAVCICDRLRACEQRVRAESKKPAYLCTECWHREDGHSCKRPQLCMCRDCNYAAGLDAAREAVAKEAQRGPLYSVRNSDDAQRGWDAMSRHALAAIDALRGES